MGNAARETWAEDKTIWGAALPGLHGLTQRQVKKGMFNFYRIELLGIGREILCRGQVMRIQPPYPVVMRPTTRAEIQRPLLM